MKKGTKSKATFFSGQYAEKGKAMQCTAHVKGGTAQCKRYAVPGKAVCRVHGGMNPGPPKQIGRYGRYADQSLQEKLNELYSDTDYKNVKDELILLRGLIGQEFERAKEAKKRIDGKKDDKGNPIYDKDTEVKAYKIIELVKEIRSTVETIERIENERQYMLSVKNVERLMYAWISILGKHITDVSTLVSIQKELSTTLIDSSAQPRLGEGDRKEASYLRSGSGKERSDVLLPEDSAL